VPCASPTTGDSSCKRTSPRTSPATRPRHRAGADRQCDRAGHRRTCKLISHSVQQLSATARCSTPDRRRTHPQRVRVGGALRRWSVADVVQRLCRADRFDTRAPARGDGRARSTRSRAGRSGQLLRFTPAIRPAKAVACEVSVAVVDAPCWPWPNTRPDPVMAFWHVGRSACAVGSSLGCRSTHERIGVEWSQGWRRSGPGHGAPGLSGHRLLAVRGTHGRGRQRASRTPTADTLTTCAHRSGADPGHAPGCAQLRS